jgi:hypothetical protein
MDNAPSMSKQFNAARDAVAAEKFRLEAFNLRQDEIRVETGQVAPENISRRTRVGRYTGKNSQREKNKQATDRMIFDTVLKEMRERLDVLDARMEKRYAELEVKYGKDNVAAGMADTFLSPDVLTGLKTDEDRFRALAKEFLNPDGTIKDKYKDLEEAKFIRDWREAEKLRPVVTKYENATDLTPEMKQEIYDVARDSGLSAKASSIVKTASQEVAKAIDNQVTGERLENDASTTSSTLVFGQS